jgi:subtilisin family serine protease
MATPHVSGVAALLLAAEPSLTPRQIKEIFKETAVDLELSLNTQGAGRIDALAAWKLATEDGAPEPPPTPTPEPPPEPPPPEPPKGCLGSFLALFRK